MLRFGIYSLGSSASPLLWCVVRWVCIALTTFIIRIATVPLLVNQLKATTKLRVKCPNAILLSSLLPLCSI
jgi:membrane protein insertase Oxa1/YidC/SpoIIIJ